MLKAIDQPREKTKEEIQSESRSQSQQKILRMLDRLDKDIQKIDIRDGFSSLDQQKSLYTQYTIISRIMSGMKTIFNQMQKSIKMVPPQLVKTQRYSVSENYGSSGVGGSSSSRLASPQMNILEAISENTYSSSTNLKSPGRTQLHSTLSSTQMHFNTARPHHNQSNSQGGPIIGGQYGIRNLRNSFKNDNGPTSGTFGGVMLNFDQVQHSEPAESNEEFSLIKGSTGNNISSKRNEFGSGSGMYASSTNFHTPDNFRTDSSTLLDLQKGVQGFAASKQGYRINFNTQFQLGGSVIGSAGSISLGKNQQERGGNAQKMESKGTDTAEDYISANQMYDKAEQSRLIKELAREADENILQLEKYISNKPLSQLTDFSGVTIGLKDLFKNLQKHKFETEQIIAKEDDDDKEGPREPSFDIFRLFLNSQFKYVQRETAEKIFQYINKMLRKQRMDKDNGKDVKKKQIINKKLEQPISITKTPRGKKIKKDHSKINLNVGKTQADSLQQRILNLEKKIQEEEGIINNKQAQLKDLKIKNEVKEKVNQKLNVDLESQKRQVLKLDQQRRQLLAEYERVKNNPVNYNDLSGSDADEDLKKKKIAQMEREITRMKGDIQHLEKLKRFRNDDQIFFFESLCYEVSRSMLPSSDKKFFFQFILNLFMSSISSQTNSPAKQNFLILINKLIENPENSESIFDELPPAKLQSLSMKSNVGSQSAGAGFKRSPSKKDSSFVSNSSQGNSQTGPSGNLNQSNSMLPSLGGEAGKLKGLQNTDRSESQYFNINDQEGEEYGQSSYDRNNNNSFASKTSNKDLTSKGILQLDQNQSKGRGSIEQASPSGRNNGGGSNSFSSTNNQNAKNDSSSGGNSIQEFSNRDSDHNSQDKSRSLHLNKQNSKEDRSNPNSLDGDQEPENTQRKLSNSSKQLNNISQGYQNKELHNNIIKQAKHQDETEQESRMQSDLKKQAKSGDDSQKSQLQSSRKNSGAKGDSGSQQTGPKESSYLNLNQTNQFQQSNFDPSSNSNQNSIINQSPRNIESQTNANSDSQESQGFGGVSNRSENNQIANQMDILGNQTTQKMGVVPQFDAVHTEASSDGNMKILDTLVTKEKFHQKSGTPVNNNGKTIKNNNSNDSVLNKARQGSDYSDSLASKYAQDKQTPNIECASQEVQTDLDLVWPIVALLLQQLGFTPQQIAMLKTAFEEQVQNGIEEFNKALNIETQQNPDLFKPPSIQKGQKTIDLRKHRDSIDDAQNPASPFSQQNGGQNRSDDGTPRDLLNRIQIQKDEDLLNLFSSKNKNQISMGGPQFKKSGSLGAEDSEGNEDDEIDMNNLEVLDDKAIMNEPTIKKIFAQFMKSKDPKSDQIQRLIRFYSEKQGVGPLTYEEFQNFYTKIITIHQRCGDHCIHLKRFFSRIGFTTTAYQNRVELKPFQTTVSPFALPTANLINNQNSSIQQTGSSHSQNKSSNNFYKQN